MGAPKILIVEDDISVARHTEAALGRMGYQVVAVQTTSEQAVGAALELQPHLILMDITINGDTDGIDTATIIRERMDIPIIFLTASTDNTTLQRAKNTEPYGFIIKPFDEHELRATIEVALYKHRVQQRLRDHEQWLSTVMNSIGDAVIGTDTQGRIRLFNAVAEQLTGFPASQAVGCLFADIVHLHCGDSSVVLPYNRSGVGMEPLAEGTELCTAAGVRLPVEGTVSSIGSAGVVVAFRDIANRRLAEDRLQQSEERYRSVMQQSADCIFLVDTDTNCIVETNTAMPRLLGYDPEEVLGMSLYDLAAHDRASVDEKLQRIRREGVCEVGERLYRRKDGSLVDVDVRASLVSYSGKNLYCIISRDITDRKRIEQNLRESEARFRSIYEQSPVMMQSVDEAGTIRNVNQKWLSVMGYSRDEVIGRNILEFMVPEDADHARTVAFPQCWEQGAISDVHYRFVRRDGCMIDVLLSCSIASDSVHQRINLAVFQDITEQKRAEEELIRSRRKYSELIRNVPIAIMRFLIAENRYEFVNNAFERQSGYTLSEVELLNDEQLIEMIHEKDRYRVFNAFRLWQQTGYQDVQHITYRILNKQGNVVWIDSYMYADFNDEGQAVALNQICVDISGLKKAERALSDTLREDFRRTVQNLQNLVIRLYMLPDGNYAYSLREGKLAGELTTAVVRGKTPFDIYGNAHDALVRPYIMRAFGGESITFEMELDGKWFFYLLEPVIENGKVEEVVGSAVDITPQKNTERLLRNSEQKFRVLVENLPIAIVQSVLEPDGRLRLQYVNPQYERNTGYTAADRLAMSQEEQMALYHPDDRDDLLGRWDRWKQSPDDTALQCLFRFRHKSGEYRWFDNHAIKYPTGNGGFALIETLLDVTDQKVGEERLRRLASFPEQDPNPIIELDLSGAIRYVNPTAQRLFPELEQQNRTHPVIAWVWEHLDTLLRRPGRVLSRELELDGEVYEQAALYLAEVGLLRIFCYRITERKRAEEQLRKALVKERELSSLKTRFVTTVSHEFRTPLTGILMSAELLERYSERMSGADRAEEVHKIKKRVHELTDLMNDFLLQSSAGSLGTTFSPVQVNMAALCAEVVHDHTVGAADETAVQCSIAQDIPPVAGDPKLLRLVVQNIVSNALKFSAEGAPVYLELYGEKNSVVLRVSDRGIGIPAEEISHLFTPFYRATNAARIPGTGIGLSIVKEFVELHHGEISVQSEYGKGSTFTVVLPVGVSSGEEAD